MKHERLKSALRENDSNERPWIGKELILLSSRNLLKRSCKLREMNLSELGYLKRLKMLNASDSRMRLR